MTDPTTTTIAAGARDSETGRSSGSGDAFLSPEITEELSQRVGMGALIYAGTWTAAFIYFTIRGATAGDAHGPSAIHVTTFVLSVSMALLVYRATRRRKCTPHALARMAMWFLLLGSLGIAGGTWGCETRMAADFARLAAAAGATDSVAFAERLESNLMNPFHLEGPTWVSVWMLAFPFIYPMSPRRITLAALISSLMVPGLMIASFLVNGAPETVARWLDDMVIDVTIPLFICAGITIAIATRAHRMTRDLARAREMGSYQLVELIGKGGMGEVWRARHRMLVRPAAIKLIRADVGGSGASDSTGARGKKGVRPKSGSAGPPTLLKRFEREAQATANLTSPHTIEIYDFGVTDDGIFYYVMELLDGLDLNTLVERHGPLPPARVVHFLHQACHSLRDAHANGLVHRDVKPANLFTCRRGQDLDVIKVLDFGLVKDVETGADSTRLTTDGSTTGTPAFMAPEMVYGHHTVDARADIYALGCVGYWLVTGKLVFESDTAMAMLVKHAKDAPVPPSQRTDHDVPQDLERIILDCLEKDPDARPAGAETLARRLETCASFGTWSQEDAGGWWRENGPQEETAGTSGTEKPTAAIS